MKENLRKYIGEIMLVLGSVSFSFEWFFIRNLSSSGYSTFDITFIRAFGALIVLSVILPTFFREALDFKKISKSDLKYFTILGFVAILTNILFNLAFQYTTVANVLVILYLSVFWGILFGILFLKEKSSVKKIIYTLLAFLGICLALVKGENEIALSIGIGELLALITSFVWTMDSVISRKIKHTNPFFRMIFIYFIMTVGTFLIIITINDFSYLQNFISRDFLIYGFGLAITAGVLGKGFMYLGINYVPVSIALVIMLLEPIAQMITAYFFANESISFLNILGIATVLVMVLLISMKNKIKSERQMKLEVPYYSQHRDIKDEYWQSRACGLVCLKMVLDFYQNGRGRTSPILDGFLKNIGGKWLFFYHQNSGKLSGKKRLNLV